MLISSYINGMAYFLEPCKCAVNTVKCKKGGGDMTSLCRKIISEGNKLSRGKNYKMGIAGSIVKGECSYSSDIDIVVDFRNISLEEMLNIEEFFSGKFNRKVDIVNLPLLEEEDEELDNMLIRDGIGANEYSIYKSIKKEVVWFGEKP